MSDINIRSLREQLDKIDESVVGDVFDKYYQSRLRILVGMWQKGEVIAIVFRGVKTMVSYNELSRQTGRAADALKRWHDIYKEYPDKEQYIDEVGKPKAEEWSRKALEKEKKYVSIPKEVELPEGKYQILYADPPWKYLLYADPPWKYPREQHGKEEQDTVLETHFPTLTTEEICDYHDESGRYIKDLPADNSVLFLWVPSPKLEESFEVIKAWGFTYKASMIWDKVKHNVGYYVSVRHEFLLICTKGSYLPQNKRLFDSVVSIERSDTHSEKPERFREIIDELYPEGRRIELFARTEVDGWDSWGLESPNKEIVDRREEAYLSNLRIN